jgi:hypothetical protein
MLIANFGEEAYVHTRDQALPAIVVKKQSGWFLGLELEY